MAIINKTGITNGGTVQAEHITRTIDALSGVSTDSIVATGSLLGTASYALTAATASTIRVTNDTSASSPLAILLSNSTGNGTTSQLVNMDPADFAFNPIANRLTVANISGTTSSLSQVTMTASFASTASVAIKIPVTGPPTPGTARAGDIFFDVQNTNIFWIYNGTDWVSFSGSIGTP
jgi:hypothetical protein